MCADLVDVRWKDRSGRSCRAVANLEDISVSGVCLQVDVQIPVYSEVRITYPSGEYTGVVRYCQCREFGHFVGVQFETGSRWSRTSFQPMHLLDPKKLAKRGPVSGKSGSGQ